MSDSDLGGAGDVEFWRAEAARCGARAERWQVEAERLAVEAQRLAAEDAVLRAQVADLKGQVGALTEKVSVLAKMAFGTSSEKAKRAPGDSGGGEGTAGEGTAGGPAKRGRGQQRGTRGHGRRDYSHLRTREEVHDVPESGGARVAARGMPGSGRSVASRSTGRSS